MPEFMQGAVAGSPKLDAVLVLRSGESASATPKTMATSTDQRTTT